MKLNVALASIELRTSALRVEIEDQVARLGSTLIGFAPVSRWADAGEVPPD